MATRLHGDEAKLYAEYSDRLRATVSRRVGTSADNIEDACSFAWFQLMRTDPGRGFPVLAWLTTVAVREAIRLDKRERRTAELTDLHHESVGDRRAELDEKTRAREALRALADLPDRQRDLVSRKVAGYSYDEIGEQTGDSFRTVERQLVRARKKLRDRT
jgi:RNA polymerase sigma factor (sigma-70 family)